MKVFIIEGHTGEYSDHRDWMVRGYLNEEMARREATRMSAIAREVQDEFRELRFSYTPDAEARQAELKKYLGDPNFDADYTGTNYSVIAVDIVDLGWPEKEST